MKKSKLLILGLIALMLVGGLVLASCHAACDGAGTCSLTYKDGKFKGSMCTSEGCYEFPKEAPKDGTTFDCGC